MDLFPDSGNNRVPLPTPPTSRSVIFRRSNTIRTSFRSIHRSTAHAFVQRPIANSHMCIPTLSCIWHSNRIVRNESGQNVEQLATSSQFYTIQHGGVNWQVAPLVLMFLLNTGLMSNILELPLSIISRVSGSQNVEGQEANSNSNVNANSNAPPVTGMFGLPYGLFDLVFVALLSFCIMKFVQLARRVGVGQAMRRVFLTGFQGRFGGGQNAQRSQRDKFERVAKAVQKLPTETFVSEEQLKKMSIGELMERLGRCNVDGKKFTEKSELVNALCKEGDSSTTFCSICCDDYGEGDVLRVLPCAHKFHLECIDRWFLSSTDYSRPPSCPYCNCALPDHLAQ